MKVELLRIGFRKLMRYLRYYDAPMIDKIIVLSLMGERQVFNFFYYRRTKIRNYFVNRVYKHPGDHHFV